MKDGIIADPKDKSFLFNKSKFAIFELTNNYVFSDFVGGSFVNLHEYINTNILIFLHFFNNLLTKRPFQDNSGYIFLIEQCGRILLINSFHNSISLEVI